MIGSSNVALVGASVAEKIGVPFVMALGNAWQLKRLGVAVPALDRHALTATALAASLQLAGSALVRQRAAALGALIRAEDGMRGAVRQREAWRVLL